MKKFTLRNRINRLTIGSLALVGTIIFCAIMGYAYIKYNMSKIASFELLRSSISNQVQQILPALLVEEQLGGLSLLLERIKNEEGLSEIYFVPKGESSLIEMQYRECNFLSEITQCQFKNKIVVISRVGVGDTFYGYFLKTKIGPTFSLQNQQLYFVEILMLILFSIFSVQFLILSRLTSKEVPNSLNSLLEWINSEISTSNNKISKPNLQFEEFNELAEKISILIKENEQQKVQAKIGFMASQVSHDIRSPLAALNLIVTDLSQISEEKRFIIRSAVNRITDIANQLLQKGKEHSKQRSNFDFEGNEKVQLEKELECVLVAPIVESIISEKRIQIREKQSVGIFSDFSKSYGIFTSVNTVELKRALSNIIQNSIEAFEKNVGKIEISIENSSDMYAIKIEDNGRGIPDNILNKIGMSRITYGKENLLSGSGLGLFHAKHFVESNGGEFHIESQLGIGTIVYMKFKKEKSPSWFVDKIRVNGKTTIVSVDDDISIHQLWGKRFSQDKLSSFIEHKTYTSGLEFKAYFESLDKNRLGRNFIFLIDYEFLNQKDHGLDIIRQLDIADSAILVTSYYDDERVLSRCKELGVRLIPKTMAGFIALEKPMLSFDSVLIDDDTLIHSIWKIEAARSNRNFVGFYSFDEFGKHIDNISQNAEIFVDYNLGEGAKGREVSHQISQLGFENIYISTGMGPDCICSMPWVKKIVGKSPIFFSEAK